MGPSQHLLVSVKCFLSSPSQVSEVVEFADGYNFDTLLGDKAEMEKFRAFLEAKHKQGKWVIVI